MFIVLINIERAYANSVVNNDMDRIIDRSLAVEMAETAISFNVFYELIMIDSFVRIFHFVSRPMLEYRI